MVVYVYREKDTPPATYIALIKIAQSFGAKVFLLSSIDRPWEDVINKVVYQHERKRAVVDNTPTTM